jgi:phosphoribosylanthranilate isomerase
MAVRVKICGLKTPEAVAAAVDAGAAYLGFNFFPRSPRFVAPVDAGRLAVTVPPGVAKVALTVDADDATLDAIIAAMPVDMLQLHGAETPARVAAVKARYGLPVMKVVGVAGPDDLAVIGGHLAVSDQIMVDAKAPKGAVLPGGNGVTFDWTLLSGRRWPVPWMLAGGLTPANVAEAVRITGARQVDVASGVESAPGVKDAALMRAFVAAAG